MTYATIGFSSSGDTTNKAVIQNITMVSAELKTTISSISSKYPPEGIVSIPLVFFLLLEWNGFRKLQEVLPLFISSEPIMKSKRNPKAIYIILPHHDDGLCVHQ